MYLFTVTVACFLAVLSLTALAITTAHLLSRKFYRAFLMGSSALASATSLFLMSSSASTYYSMAETPTQNGLFWGQSFLSQILQEAFYHQEIFVTFMSIAFTVVILLVLLVFSYALMEAEDKEKQFQLQGKSKQVEG